MADAAERPDDFKICYIYNSIIIEMNINDLLTKGFFAEELTPTFTTSDLSNISQNVILNLHLYDPLTKGKKLTSKCVPYSIPKIKGYRRNLGIPNPLNYIRLCDTIVKNWSHILSHCNTSPISLSRLKTKYDSSRAVVKPSFDVLNREKIIRATGYRYVLKIDITRFYHSIYTHSIPWAIHTKVVSKLKRDRTLFGNALDEDSRRMQDSQTIGIPIGPDTSRIISEIILSSIDLEIQSELKYLVGIRVVDDYHLYFKNQGDVEIAKAAIQKILKDFELELNQSKEEIFALPEMIESEWLHDLREFKFRNGWKTQRTDLIAFFDKVYLYAERFPNDFVLTYAVAKIQSTVFNPKNFKILQALLLNSLTVEPKILPTVAQILLSYHQKAYRLNLEMIKQALEDTITFHLSLGNDFEICWSLWILKSLKIVISKDVVEQLSKVKNDIIILTILDLSNSGCIFEGLDLSLWESFILKDNLYSEHWLLAYEAKVKGWLTSVDNYVLDDPFFKLLADSNVSFYKAENTLDLSKNKVTSFDFYYDDDDNYLVSDDEEEIDLPPVEVFVDESDDLPF